MADRCWHMSARLTPTSTVELAGMEVYLQWQMCVNGNVSYDHEWLDLWDNTIQYNELTYVLVVTAPAADSRSDDTVMSWLFTVTPSSSLTLCLSELPSPSPCPWPWPWAGDGTRCSAVAQPVTQPRHTFDRAIQLSDHTHWHTQTQPDTQPRHTFNRAIQLSDHTHWHSLSHSHVTHSTEQFNYQTTHTLTHTDTACHTFNRAIQLSDHTHRHSLSHSHVTHSTEQFNYQTTHTDTHRHAFKFLPGCEEVEHCTLQPSWTSQLPTTPLFYTNFTSQRHKY